MPDVKQTELKRKAPMRRTKKKRKRRKPDKDNPHSLYWRNRADTLWSKVIRLPGKCLMCPRTDNLQAHHNIRRDAVFYRHRLENGVCLCPNHHMRSLENSAHGAPWGFEAWLRENHPKQYDWWTAHRHNVITGQKMDYRSISEDLQLILDEGKAFRWTCRRLGVTPEGEA